MPNEKKKAGRPKGTNHGITKKEILHEISNNTELRYDIVEQVFNNLQDIMIREIILKEKFVFPNVFSVSSYEKPKRKGFNKRLNKVVTYPPTNVLTIKLSNKVKYFQRWKMRNINNKKYNVTPENWYKLWDAETLDKYEETD